jgi:hypothetical protein
MISDSNDKSKKGKSPIRLEISDSGAIIYLIVFILLALVYCYFAYF